MLARACGGTGFSVRDPARLESTLREAFATAGPVIVDAVVAADKIPNVPHLDFEQVDHYAVAKIKEALFSIMGSRRIRSPGAAIFAESFIHRAGRTSAPIARYRRSTRRSVTDMNLVCAEPDVELNTAVKTEPAFCRRAGRSVRPAESRAGAMVVRPSGFRAFEAITALPEYYPTRTEHSILARHASDIAERVAAAGW